MLHVMNLERRKSRSAQLAAGLMQGELVVAGVLSGTSADGIDVALMRPHFAYREGILVPWDLGLIAFETLAFPGDLAGRLRALLDRRAGPGGPSLPLGELARLDCELGRAFGASARALAQREGLELGLVGSHGQTVWHHDGQPPLASMQIGDGDFVASEAGSAVVSDFRMRDLAAGGGGAPIGALVDPWLFLGHGDGDMCVLNLGGFGNLSLFSCGVLSHSFDIGPAGALLDHFARRLLGEPMDRGGATALGGCVDLELEALWFEMSVNGNSLSGFAAQSAPKSTGREAFGAAWCEALLTMIDGHLPADLMATAVELVAHGVGAGLALAARSSTPVVPVRIELAGGGAHNVALVNAIARRTGLSVRSSAESGIDPDAREALIFGLLAAAHVLEIALPVNASLTGAAAPLVLGKFSPAGMPCR